MKRSILIIALAFAGRAFCQDTTESTKTNPLQFSGYAEAYYSYDFNKPSSNTKPGYLYNHNRHNEININLAFLKAAYSADRMRATLALAAGTYINANYAAEPGVIKNLYEANIGVKLSRSHNLWLDIGILPSHIGFEGAVGKDCWTLTRSLVAENSPYFEGGAKIGYSSNNGKFSAAVLALNGWQRITRVDGNSLMSSGLQLTYKPNDKLLFNYSNFIGTDKPDSIRAWRIYNNFYSIIQFNPQWGLTAGFDVGAEQKSKGSSDYNVWYSPVAIVRYTPSAAWAFALRGEYFSDSNQVLISSTAPGGFKASGLSVNADYWLLQRVLMRVEFRHLNGAEKIFEKEGVATNNMPSVSFSTSIYF